MKREQRKRTPRGSRFWAALLLTGVVGGAGAGPALAQYSSPVDFSLGLSSRAPASRTSASLYILYKQPGAPQAKPSSLKRVVIALPAGAAYNGSSVPACQPSDEQLMVLAEKACPSSSDVGGGTVTALTGFGPPTDPVTFDATFFNQGGGLILLLTQHGSAMLVVRGKFTAANTLAFDALPSVPGGPPDFMTAVRQVKVSLRAVGSASKPFVRTPSSCPASRGWVSHLSYATGDGHSYVAASTTPCAPHNQARRRKAQMRVSVQPRHASAGTLVRYRFTVHARRRACLREVSIRVGGRRARSNREGDASLRLRIRRPGRYRVRAAKHGCGSALAFIRVSSPGGATTPPRPGTKTSFDGSCQFSGTVSFTPKLTDTSQPGQVFAKASGPCTGTLSERDGTTRQLRAQSVRVVAESQGQESCASGSGHGFGYVDFDSSQIQFTYTEVRAGGALTLNASGAAGGSASAEANVSPSANPPAILQACASSGLAQAPIDIRLSTTPSISG